MDELKTTLESIDDPEYNAKVRAQHERAIKNSRWLAAHWSDFLPQARGRHIAVAGEEGHIAETAEDAWAWVEATHPEDDGALVQYVLTTTGPRIYGNRG